MFLADHGISPYSGDTFHETPIFLRLYQLLQRLPRTAIPFFFIALDIVTGLLLGWSSLMQLQQMIVSERPKLANLKAEDRAQLEVPADDIWRTALRVFTIYLLSPYSILACTAQSTAVIGNFLVAALIYSATCGNRLISCMLTALVAAQSLYPVILLIPVVLFVEHRRALQFYKTTVVDFRSHRFWVSSTITCILFGSALAALLYASYQLAQNSWEFASSTYGFLYALGLTINETSDQIICVFFLID